VTSVYVASPLGFFDAGKAYNELVKAALRAASFEPVDPWHDPEGTVARELERIRALPDAAGRAHAFSELNGAIGAENARLIAEADSMLAILDGSDVDSGTAAEVGYACALSTPVIGLRTDTRCSGDNEGTPINLQVRFFIERSGGRIVTAIPDAIECLLAATAPPS